jgi:hypothetical protein
MYCSELVGAVYEKCIPGFLFSRDGEIEISPRVLTPGDLGCTYQGYRVA